MAKPKFKVGDYVIRQQVINDFATDRYGRVREGTVGRVIRVTEADASYPDRRYYVDVDGYNKCFWKEQNCLPGISDEELTEQVDAAKRDLAKWF